MNTLIDKLRQQQGKLLFRKDVHGSLPYNKIVERVKLLIQRLEELNINFAYGITDFSDPQITTEDVYDPIALLDAEPGKIELIQHMVSYDIEHHLSTLLSRKDDCAHSYNILVFGCAIYVANSMTIPSELQSFLIDHLLDPPMKLHKRVKGRPKKPITETILIGSAVSFAKQHGLTSTRYDESANKESACDAVGKAVSELLRETNTKLSCSNYDAVQKIWQKYKKLP